MKRILLLTLILVGCGQESTPDHVDYRGITTVSYDNDVVKNDPTVYDNAFIYVRDCMLTNEYITTPNIPGPFIHVVSYRPFGFDGYTEFRTGTIIVNLKADIRHEMVHYFLWKTGLDNQKNANHQHEAFIKCGRFDFVPLSVIKGN